jgi:mitogen-activated protein kinase 1/3
MNPSEDLKEDALRERLWNEMLFYHPEVTNEESS